jgi:hypothetical protein
MLVFGTLGRSRLLRELLITPTYRSARLTFPLPTSPGAREEF